MHVTSNLVFIALLVWQCLTRINLFIELGSQHETVTTDFKS